MVTRSRILLSLAVLLVTGSRPAPAGAECLDYSNYFHWVSTTQTATSSNRVAAKGNFAFVCSGAPGLMIFDVTDPASPQLLRLFDTPGSCSDVLALGDYVLVADGASGLQTVDVSDPSNPIIAHTFAPGTISTLGIEGSRLAAIGGGQFRLIDVTDPLAPFGIGSLAVSAGYDVELQGNLAFLGGSGGMRVIDISAPAAPVQVGLYPVTGYVSGLDVMGEFVCLANPGAGFETSYNFLVNVSDPSAPVTVWTQYTYVGAFDVVVDGTVAFLFGSSGDLEAWDFAVPGSPTLLLTDAVGYPGRLVLAGGYLFMTGYYSLALYDVSPLQVAPLVLSYPDLWSYPNVMRVAGSHVYAAGRFFGDPWIDLIDCGDPAAPVWLNGYQVGHYRAVPTALEVIGNYLLVALSKWSISVYSQSGLAVVDVTNPAAPATVALRATTKGSGGLAVVGNYVYMGQLDSTVAIFNIQSPTNPVFVTEFQLPGVAVSMTLSGNRLHVAAGEAGGMILDVTNPLAPVLISTYDTPGQAGSIIIQGSLAYVADNWGGVWIFDVADPVQPVAIGNSPVSALSIALEGNFAYVASGEDVSVLDISTPSTPRLVGAQSSVHSYDAVALVGPVVYSCGTDGSLNVLSLQCVPSGGPAPDIFRVSQLRLSPGWPNPSSGRVSLVADLPAAGSYRGVVFDVAGRLISKLPAVVVEHPGPVFVTWDGNDEDGSPAPDGVYFVTFTNGSAGATRKVVRAR